jgi:hypothetical protein
MEMENQNIVGLKQLPVELIHHIISYTYSPQSEELIMDIHMYHNSMANIHGMFYNTFYGGDNTDIYKIELLDALVLYCNNYIPLHDGYHEDFYKIWNRFPLFKKYRENDDINRSKIDEYIEKIFILKSINTRINMLWGIFTHGERLNFIIDHLDFDN